MESILTIDNLNFSYKGQKIFNNFNFKVEKGKWTTIVGPNGGGKSTLVKIIMGLIKCDSEIIIDGIKLEEKTFKDIRKKIGVLFEYPDATFVAETVMDEMAFALENLEKDKEYIKSKIKEVSDFLEITDLLESNPTRLSGGQKQLVALASILVADPIVLILDEAINRIDNYERTKILKMLKRLNAEKNITIINITHDIEESVYSDDIILIDQGKVILKGPKELVFKEEKIFNMIGIELPFMVQLSLKLQFYELIDDMILDMDEMVDKLWK